MTRLLLFGLLVVAALGVVLLSNLGSGEDPVDPLGRPQAPPVTLGGAPSTEVEGPGSPTSGSDPAPGDPAARRRVPAGAAPTEEDLGPQRLDLGDEHLDVVVVFDDGSPATRVDFLLDLTPIGPAGAHGLRMRSQEGHYRIEGLSRGSWHLLAHAPPRFFGDPVDFQTPRPVPHPGPAPVLTLRRAGGIEGRVVDAEGQPAEAEIRLGGYQGGPSVEARTAGGGGFRFGPIPPGTLSLHATSEFGLSTELEVEVAAGQVLEGVELRLPAGGWIEVAVLDRVGDPAQDADVVLLTDEQLVGGDEADEDGRARFGPLPAGAWSVVAVLDEGERGILSAHLDVVAGETARVELRPPTVGITVSGVVTQGGRPVAGERMYLFREGQPLIEGVSMAGTDPEGHYELQVPAPGPLQVMVEHDHPILIARVVIPDQPTFRLDLRVPAGRVSGRVIGADVEGGHWRVLLEREDGYLDTLFPDARPGERTQRDGSFEFECVRPGRYRLRLPSGDGVFAPPLTGVLVGEDEQVEGLELRLQAGGALRVEVRHADGTPVTDASVLVRDMAGLPLIDLPRPAPGGVLRLDGLPPGRVLVSAQSAQAVAVGEARVDLEREGSVDLVLEPGAHLTVRAERDGQPTGASIRLFGPDGAEVTRMLALADYRPGYTAVVSSSTRRFGPLPPVRYEVRVTTPQGVSWLRSVRLAAGEARELVAELR